MNNLTYFFQMFLSRVRRLYIRQAPRKRCVVVRYCGGADAPAPPGGGGLLPPQRRHQQGVPAVHARGLRRLTHIREA